MRANLIGRAFAASSTAVLLLSILTGSQAARAEDGYDLWLRYRPLEATWLRTYRAAATEIVGGADSAVLQAARSELTRALAGLLQVAPRAATRPTRDGAIVFGTARSSRAIAALQLDLSAAGPNTYQLAGSKCEPVQF